MKQVSFYGHPDPNGTDNDVEWVRKMSRASGDLVNILVREREKEREGESHPSECRKTEKKRVQEIPDASKGGELCSRRSGFFYGFKYPLYYMPCPKCIKPKMF
ncbi:hypothetical protein ACS0PU_009188 [Formica fusca]